MGNDSGIKNILGGGAGALGGPIGMIGAAVLPGLIKGIGSLFGRRKRKEEMRKRKRAYDRQIANFRSFEFENPFEGQENPFEELEVSTEAAEFQAQEQQAGLAQSLSALRGAGGGTGAAAIASAIASQQRKNQQLIAANIAKQEAANTRTKAVGEMQLNAAEAQGAMAVQQLEFNRESTITGMEQQLYAGALQTQAADRRAASEGLGSALIGGVAGIGAVGGFGSKIQNFLTGKGS